MSIEEIKSKLSLAVVLHHYSLKPDRNYRLNCPFHEDKTPSMQVYYKTQSAYCFSTNCKTHGKSLDVIDFVMHKENVSKGEAIEKAKELMGSKPSVMQPSKHPPLPVKPPTHKREEILERMFNYFKNALQNSKPSQDYVKSRNLEAAKLEIGYNTGQFHHGERRSESLITNCVWVGLLSPCGISRTGEEAYKAFGKYCICFALRDRGNHISGLYFRSTVNNSEGKHFYLKDSRGLYPHYPKPQTEKLIITESIIDAASLLQIEDITKDYSLLAAYGTNRLTEEMKAAIKELKDLKEITFAFDNDEAGRKAALKYAEELKEALPHVVYSTLELPCKDVNETLLAHSEGLFAELLKRRKNFFLSSEIRQEQKPAEKENVSITNASKLTTSNPYKLIYQGTGASYQIKGGVDKVMSKLSVTLEIISGELMEGINKRRFRVDLYDTKQVEKMIEEAAAYLQLNKTLLETDIHALTESLDDYREEELQQTKEASEIRSYVLSPAEKSKAMELSKDKNLLKQIQTKLSQSGIVGEEENKTFLYIIAASHIQENPLNALIQGSSGSGKTNLLKGIYKTIPEENKKIYSRLSEKMLYNVPKYYFKNKLICFEDVDGLGEEAEYAWRELVSNGELVSGVSYKDEKGNIGIKELTVYGPITSIACTTKGAIYADNMSRLFLIATDESKAQTKKINEYQGQEAAGQIDKAEQQRAIKELQNLIRILSPCKVYNPFALKLKLPEGIQDERRIYKLYLHFIEIITVLHQYQRERTGDQKLITEKQDCQIAKDLLFECIMLKMDELDGSLRQFFERLKEYVSKQSSSAYEFTQREIRGALHVKKTQLSYYINELQNLEYIQQVSSHINKGNRYKVQHFDNYRKMREEVKSYLQKQIDALPDKG